MEKIRINEIRVERKSFRNSKDTSTTREEEESKT